MNIGRYRHVLALGVVVAALFLVACGADSEPTAIMDGAAAPSGGSASVGAVAKEPNTRLVEGSHLLIDFGIPSLEAKILSSDIVAIVTLSSVDRGLTTKKAYDGLRYAKTLEFTFEVEEYLKGEGPGKLIGLVFEFDDGETQKEEAKQAKDLLPTRKTRWDDRKAVVFLRDEAKDPLVNWDANRYWLGVAREDYASYSIEGLGFWMPAASNRADEQSFLLESDLIDASPRTATFDELRLMVKSLEEALEGQSDVYAKCVLDNYRWRDRLQHEKATQGEGFYIKQDASIASGAPMGTYVISSWSYGIRDPNPPEGTDLIALGGQDPEYFYGVAPGHLFTERPLPAGQYRFNYAHYIEPLFLCGWGVNEDDLARSEVILEVAAPDGILHEAFFDPVTVDKAIVADKTSGRIEPTKFSDAQEVSVSIRSIAWEGEAGGAGTVSLTLWPQNDLADASLDFISLDGNVVLSLAANDAKADEDTGTLLWKVAEQPWVEGDRLMLRISG